MRSATWRRRKSPAVPRRAAVAGEARRHRRGRGRDRAAHRVARDRQAGHRCVRRRVPRHRPARARGDRARALSRAVRGVAAGTGASTYVRRGSRCAARRRGSRHRRAGSRTCGCARAAGRVPADVARAVRRGGRAARRGRDLHRPRPHRRDVARLRRGRRPLRRQGTRRRVADLGGALRKTDLEQVWDFGEEDLYTHTHSGNPLACAAALVVLDEVPKLLHRVDEVLSERFAVCRLARQGAAAHKDEAATGRRETACS